MESIYRDAYPDIFATFEDDYESLKADVAMQRLEDEDNVDKDKSKSVR